MAGKVRGTWAALSVNPGSGAWVICHAYPGKAPILEMHGAPVSVSITPAGRGEGPVTAADVDLARQLVTAAQTYLAEMQRLHAPTDGAGTAGPERAA
ncbi:hypothetical protein Acsp03_51290 [Actinomadura sp. NBRC 104412]|nr:hypothetical protein Acsp03_51290 [Actinomadura sp. NBRC 104412]